MAGRGAILAVLSVVLAACSAGAAPTPTDRASPPRQEAAPSLATVTPTPTPAPTLAPTAVVPTPTPIATRAPTPRPSFTPRPAPPKPTGVDYARCCGEGSGDPVSSAWWKKPRTKGVEVRVYGVTVCMPLEDGSDDQCLRKGTEVPPAIRVLLAKAPASKGTVSWYQDEDPDEADLCAGAMLDKHGTRYYSVVIAAYGPDDHSQFAIADPGWYDSEQCTAYVVQKGDTLAKIAGQHGLTVANLVAANLSTLPDPNKLRVGGVILIPSSFLVEE